MRSVVRQEAWRSSFPGKATVSATVIGWLAGGWRGELMGQGDPGLNTAEGTTAFHFRGPGRHGPHRPIVTELRRGGGKAMGPEHPEGAHLTDHSRMVSNHRFQLQTPTGQGVAGWRGDMAPKARAVKGHYT